MRLDINLATQPYEDAQRFWFRWGGAVLTLGIVTLGLLYFTFIGWLGARKDRILMRQYRQQIAARDREKDNAEALMNLAPNRSTRDRSQFLNDLFYRKAFSWTRVFEDLETVMPPRLHVVSIQPALAADNELAIKLVVAGDSRERVLELVRQMEASQSFRQTAIDQENAETGSGDNAGDTVKFDISAVYVPVIGGPSKSGGKP